MNFFKTKTNFWATLTKIFVTNLTIMAYWCGVAEAVEVRGRVDSQTGYGQTYPLQGAKVELITCLGPCSTIKTAYTDSNGFYYFGDADPGAYTIKINDSLEVSIEIPDQGQFDIGPILMN